LCCPMERTTTQITTSPDTTTTIETTDANEVEANGTTLANVNVRVYQIKPMTDEYEASSSSDQVVLGKPKQKRNCHCKARSSCPHKYIDYGFGFHCTYNTVRCCIPEDDVDDKSDKEPLAATNTTVQQDSVIDASNHNENGENDNTNEQVYLESNTNTTQPEVAVDQLIGSDKTNEGQSAAMMPNSDYAAPATQPLQGNGELLITEVTNLWKYDDSEKEGDCFCLPIQKCRAMLESNNIERRRDTLCPGDMIQCCGGDVLEEITKKKDDTEVDITNIKQGNVVFTTSKAKNENESY